MNHKRGRTKNQRAGCLMCKFWKVNEFSTERVEGEKFSDHKERLSKAKEIETYEKEVMPCLE